METIYKFKIPCDIFCHVLSRIISDIISLQSKSISFCYRAFERQSIPRQISEFENRFTIACYCRATLGNREYFWWTEKLKFLLEMLILASLNCSDVWLSSDVDGTKLGFYCTQITLFLRVSKAAQGPFAVTSWNIIWAARLHKTFRRYAAITDPAKKLNQLFVMVLYSQNFHHLEWQFQHEFQQLTFLLSPSGVGATRRAAPSTPSFIIMSENRNHWKRRGEKYMLK